MICFSLRDVLFLMTNYRFMLRFNFRVEQTNFEIQQKERKRTRF